MGWFGCLAIASLDCLAGCAFALDLASIGYESSRFTPNPPKGFAKRR